MKPLISGAEFHDFEATPIYNGKLVSEQVREKDGEGENQKAGSVIGFIFENKAGEQSIIGNSHSIAKAVSMVKLGDWLRIEFLGQGAKNNGQKFNRFKIDALEEADIAALPE